MLNVVRLLIRGARGWLGVFSLASIALFGTVLSAPGALPGLQSNRLAVEDVQAAGSEVFPAEAPPVTVPNQGDTRGQEATEVDVASSPTSGPEQALRQAQAQFTNMISVLLDQQLRAYLQLQEQIHATTLAVEKMRQESEKAARSNTEAMTMRLNAIEQALAEQADRHATEMHRQNQFVLWLASIFGGIGLLALVFATWFTQRSMSRLAEVTARFSQALAHQAAHGGLAFAETPAGPIGPPPQTERLLGAIKRLEQRIGELEAGAEPRRALADKSNGSPEESSSSADAEQASQASRITALLGKGQALLHADHVEAALACFDEVLELAPDHAEAWLRKAAALERLQQWNDALACYDKAIAARPTLTQAYLYKGALLNQLERYNEALACYEKALQIQEGRPSTSPEATTSSEPVEA